LKRGSVNLNSALKYKGNAVRGMGCVDKSFAKSWVFNGSSTSMASTTQHSSSRFSTLKIFRLAGSKPPPPPPKDAVYLYPSANNPSLLSLSNQSVAPTASPKQTNPSGPLSIRSPSPTPSRVLQSSSPLQKHPPPSGYHQHQSPSMSSSTLSPDSGSGSSKRGFLRKLSNIGRRSESKSSRMSSTEDASDDESISRPWNFQVSPPFSHHIHAWTLTFFPSCHFLSIPPSWNVRLPTTRTRIYYVHTHTPVHDNIAPYPHR
jgi:hypothetical protein